MKWHLRAPTWYWLTMLGLNFFTFTVAVSLKDWPWIFIAGGLLLYCLYAIGYRAFHESL